MKHPILFVAAALALTFGCSTAPPGAVPIEVSAGASDRTATPVVIPLPESLAAAAWFTLARTGSGATVPVQKLTGEPARVVFLLDEPLTAGTSRRYLLSASGGPAPQPRVTATDERRETTVRLGAKPVFVYHKTKVEPPPDADPVYAASGFIHPLYSPSGKVLTDDFPADHLHQHGLFFAWVNAVFEGRQVDFWNQASRKGHTEHFRLKEIRSGDVFAQLVVVRRYIDETAPDGEKPAVEETWTIRVYNSADPFLIDLESGQRMVGRSPLHLNRYRYGGMAIRGSSQWFQEPRAGMLTSEGKDQAEGNHTRPVWVEMFGPVDGAAAGVVMMGATTNFRFPQPVRLHPSKPYFCFAPMVAGEFDIRPGTLYVSRYRIMTHDGPPKSEINNRLWADYSKPPEVTVGE